MEAHGQAIRPQVSAFVHSRNQGEFWRFARRQPLGSISLVILLLVVLLAILAPQVASRDPYTIRVDQKLLPPSPEFLLGTDRLGRDLLSMLIFGSRVALIVGFGASCLGSVVGGVLGLVGGFFGKTIDNVIQRISDILMSFPGLILALAPVAVLGVGLVNVVVAIAIPIVPRAARVVRSAVLSTREQQYIEGAVAVGASNTRLMFIHIVPNVMAPFLIVLTAQLGTAVLTEASLSFLGLGVPPPNFSWGAMLAGHAADWFEVAPWTAIFPGLAISLVVFAVNFLGDALRDFWDPRLRS